MTTEADFIDRRIGSPPRTNEVRRSAGLIAGAHWLTAKYNLPIHLSELGASGGFNLMFDHFRLRIEGQDYGPGNPALSLMPDWSGALPPQARPVVTERRGIDLNPLNPHDADDRLRLRAYLRADQLARLALTDAAIRVAATPVDKGDAIDWLATRLSPRPGVLLLIWHSIVWQYFPPRLQARGTALIQAAGAEAKTNSPLGWLSMERDERGPGAALTLRHWPGYHHVTLGRIDFHRRWLHREAATVQNAPDTFQCLWRLALFEYFCQYETYGKPVFRPMFHIGDKYSRAERLPPPIRAASKGGNHGQRPLAQRTGRRAGTLLDRADDRFLSQRILRHLRTGPGQPHGLRADDGRVSGLVKICGQ